MTLLDIIALLFLFSALFGYINHRFLRLPHTIGLVIIALIASLALIAAGELFPALTIDETVRGLLLKIDFYELLMEGFLSLLLFAGAVHVNLSELAERKWSIAILASLGVLTSTILVGVATWTICQVLGAPIPFIWALVFGSLISPTDPVAVLGILKTVKVPRLLEAKIAGESLFNDGVGVVVFTILLAIAVGGVQSDIGVGEIANLFLVEALGGAVLGMVAGYLAYIAMRGIDEHNLEVLITLALVVGAYALALHFHISGPIAVVIAGLFIGNHGAKFAMSENTRTHVFQFWELFDELLNSVLFLLIGLEVLVVGLHAEFAGQALLVIPAVLIARWIAVAVPISLLSIKETFTKGAIPLLTWSGLRGGISVALALSLPNVSEKPVILTMTYAVVVFSIIVQGLSMKPLVRKLVPPSRPVPSDHDT